MKTWFFSECAYPYLPPDDRYESIRVTLPNGYMDPEKAADLWQMYTDLWQAAGGLRPRTDAQRAPFHGHLRQPGRADHRGDPGPLHRDGPFSWTGRFFEHRQVNIWPRPYQQPHPPVRITTTSPSSSVRIADHGYTLATFLVGRKGAPPIFNNYRQRRAELGLETSLEQLAYCGLVYVGDSEASARKSTEELMWYATSNKVALYRAVPEKRRPNNKLTPGGRDPSALRAFTHQELIEQGILFSGTPDQVYHQIADFYEHIGGFGHFLMMGQAGFQTYDQMVNSMKLFSEEVAPRLNELTAGGKGNDRVAV